MRKQTLFLSKVLVLFLVGCGGSDRTLTLEKVQPPLGFFQDSAGNPITTSTPDTATLLKVAAGKKVPVTGPDGQLVTWGQFRAVSGKLTLTCESGGTRIHLDYTGLLKGGVFTMWLYFFEAPGFAQGSFGALAGATPVGPPDGSQSTLTVDADGNATFDAVTPAGAPTVLLPGKSLTVPSCLLDSYEVLVAAAYHLDGMTYGKSGGGPDKIAEQAGSFFLQGAEE